MLYSFPNTPENIDPPAIAAVILDDIPEKSNAIAKTNEAFLPNRGTSISFACPNSVTFIPFLKNSAANIIIELFIAHPIPIEKMVSVNS